MQSEFIEFFIDRKIFFDVCIADRHVRLWLIVVVIRNEITNSVFGKKLFEFAIQLCNQGFIVGKNQRWFLCLLNHVGHGKGFA